MKDSRPDNMALKLAGASLLAAWFGVAKAAEAVRRPNLLFICADQMKDAVLEVYGNRMVIMPNLNALARESVVFLNSYVVQPVSTPSRGTMLTGTYPHCHGAVQNNMPLDPSARCLPELIDGGYATGYFGKWHLGDEIFPQHGFAEFDSVEDQYYYFYSEAKNRGARSGYHKYLVLKGYTPDGNDENIFSRKFVTTLPYCDGKPSYLASKAVDFMARHCDDPFILYVSYLEPHSPFAGPFDDLHDDIPLPSGYSCPPGEYDPVRYRARTRRMSHEQWERFNRNYAGLCHAVDRSVGTILGALDSLGLRENTIVVFTADHGEMMGSHGMLNKSVMYEEALRVPLMFRIPGKGAARIGRNVTNIDLVPTLVELLGRDPLRFGHLQGRSLVGVMNGMPRKGDDGYIYMLWNPNQDAGKSDGPVDGFTAEEIERLAGSSYRTVISPQGWKLTLSDMDRNQLFNLRNDPAECDNLYYKKGYGRIIARLTQKIKQWKLRTGDRRYVYIERPESANINEKE